MVQFRMSCLFILGQISVFITVHKMWHNFFHIRYHIRYNIDVHAKTPFNFQTNLLPSRQWQNNKTYISCFRVSPFKCSIFLIHMIIYVSCHEIDCSGVWEYFRLRYFFSVFRQLSSGRNIHEVIPVITQSHPGYKRGNCHTTFILVM